MIEPEQLEEQKKRMEDLAVEAENALVDRDIDDDALRAIGNWIDDYLGAGYKRLGRILRQYADPKRPKSGKEDQKHDEQ